MLVCRLRVGASRRCPGPATAALRAKGAGPTLVVSPLLALMRDQIAAAERAGLRAATVNSTNVEEWGEVLAVVSAAWLFIRTERQALWLAWAAMLAGVAEALLGCAQYVPPVFK